MEKGPIRRTEQSNLLAHEAEIRSEDEKLLSNLNGFQNLSQEQQRYLRTTLHIQQRAERGTDPVSNAHIQTAPPHIKAYGNDSYIDTLASPVRVSGVINPYAQSQKFIASEFCHRAIHQLETYAISDEDSSQEWVDIGEIRKEEDLNSLITLTSEQHSFPLVLEMCYKAGPPPGRLFHTTLVLGKDPQGGGFIVWEKSGLSMPFQLAKMKEVYDYYKYEGATVWRARPLRT